MRSFMLAAAAIAACTATMTFEMREANAVVCAKGVVRAGCASARGAVVVRKPVVVAPVVAPVVVTPAVAPVVVAPAVAPVVVKPAVTCRYVWVKGVRVRRCG